MNQLGIFAKYWQPGQVKTRLATAIGAEAAARIYRQCLATLLVRLEAVADRRVLAYAPADRAEEFSTLSGDRWELMPQAAGDLGERMRHYFASAFAAGARKVVLLGSDSPTLPTEYIQRALRMLDRRSVVLGPTTDGGYYLVGATGREPPIFADIRWSSTAVWQQTIDHLDAAGCLFGQLPVWYDVDDGHDLSRLRDDLERLAAAAPHWQSLLDVVRGGPAHEAPK